MKNLSNTNLREVLNQLSELTALESDECFELVVCGGSALLALELVKRTTRDIDIVGLIKNGRISDPDPLPEPLIKTAGKIAQHSNLPPDWLNTGPADLFRMGLPEGFVNRLTRWFIGKNLVIHFISRLDQIHFKLYASVDRGGYHISDLMALKPNSKEILQAAKWSQTHDVSEGFTELLKSLLKELGYEDIIAEL